MPTHEPPDCPAPGCALPPLWDDWEQEDRLWQIGRILGADPQRSTRRDPAGGPGRSRRHPAHAGPSAPHAARKDWPAAATAGATAWSALSWLGLLLGTMALVCGGVLIGWSLWTGRQDLWTIGVPVAATGQIALLLGLLLQLDRLWHEGRRAAAKLEIVDRQLHRLRTTSRLLGAGHGAPAAFYAHLSHSANPQLLLADLKAQLDLLAVRLSAGQIGGTGEEEPGTMTEECY